MATIIAYPMLAFAVGGAFFGASLWRGARSAAMAVSLVGLWKTVRPGSSRTRGTSGAP